MSPAALGRVILIATHDGRDRTYVASRRGGLELARREHSRVVLYDRSSESYLSDPYPSGPWTSQNHLARGNAPLDPAQLRALGRSYLADEVEEARSLGLEVGAALARGTGPAAMAAACEQLGVATAVLPARIAQPTLVDRVRGHTLEAFTAQLRGVDIVLVDDHGAFLPAQRVVVGA